MEIRFYHLTNSPLQRALPALLQKALSGGKRITLVAQDQKALEELDQGLWSWNPESFLPHASLKKVADSADSHPILLTVDATENANQSDTLILTGQTACEDFSRYELCCKIFNGHDQTAVEHSRALWKQYKDAGHALTYWQQDERGAWAQKAS